MNCDEFLATLDTNNPFYQEFCVLVKGSICKDLVAYAKGSDLSERVDELCRKQLCPLVDKKLQIIIGVPEGTHKWMRWILYTYHDAYDNPDADVPREDMGSTWYLGDGMGYYISSLNHSTIIVEDAYEEDTFDKALFSRFRQGTLN